MGRYKTSYIYVVSVYHSVGLRSGTIDLVAEIGVTVVIRLMDQDNSHLVNLSAIPTELLVYVTWPVKTGDVGTNYILSHERPFLSIETEYFCSVTCTIKPFKCVIRG